MLYSLSSTGARWTFKRAGKSETIRVRGPLKANSSLALHHALLQGLGLARIPLFIVHEDLARGRLVQVLQEWEIPEQGIFALTTAREHVPRKTRVFIEVLRAHLEAQEHAR